MVWLSGLSPFKIGFVTVFSALKALRSAYSISSEEKAFIRYRLSRMRATTNPTRHGLTVLIEAEPSLTPARLIALSGFLDAHGSLGPVRSVGAVFEPNLEKPRNLLMTWLSNLLIWQISLSRPRALLGAIGMHEVLLTRPARHCVKKASQEFMSMKRRGLTKDRVLNWSVGNIWIGDLVYAHYLRSFKLGTLDPESQQFERFARRFLESFFFWEDTVLKLRPRFVLVQNFDYGPAVLHRLAVSIGARALRVGIDRILVLSNSQPNSIRLVTECLREDFSSLNAPLRDSYLRRGQEQLDFRLNGGIDSGIDYLPSSQFISVDTTIQIADPENHNVLVAPHCFWESVNSHGIGLFADFVEWLTFLAGLGEKPGVDIYVKEHPNFKGYDRKILSQFLKEHPHVQILNEGVGHIDLVRQGVKVVTTDHGTIATEYPALGVPVINANPSAPHRAWGFSSCPESLVAYEKLILNPPPVSRDRARSEIAEYFAARLWREKSEKCFFFPEINSGEVGRGRTGLLERFVDLHTESGSIETQRSLLAALHQLEQEPNRSAYISASITRFFD